MAQSMDWFPFNVKDWRGSRQVRCMTAHEQGIYLLMLIEAWDHGGTLPMDLEDLGNLIGTSSSELEQLLAGRLGKVWKEVDGSYVNEHLARIYKEQSEKYERRRAAGAAKGTSGAMQEQCSSNAGATTCNREEKKREEQKRGREEAGAAGLAAGSLPPKGTDLEGLDYDPTAHCPPEVWQAYHKAAELPPAGRKAWEYQAQQLGRCLDQGGQPAVDALLEWIASTNGGKAGKKAVDIAIERAQRQATKPARKLAPTPQLVRQVEEAAVAALRDDPHYRKMGKVIEECSDALEALQELRDGRRDREQTRAAFEALAPELHKRLLAWLEDHGPEHAEDMRKTVRQVEAQIRHERGQREDEAKAQARKKVTQ